MRHSTEEPQTHPHSVEILPANALHAAMLSASGIRKEDIEEWEGGTGVPVLSSLLGALEWPGSKNEVILLDGVPLAIWGTHHAEGYGPGIGQVWFLASKIAERHVLTIHRNFDPVLEDMHSRFPLLIAYTHPNNVVHHEWMERVGFERMPFRRPTPSGIPYLTYRRLED